MVSRRKFLLTSSGAAVGLPFLPSLCARIAEAQTGAPKRFIFVFSSNGVRQTFFPSDDAPIPWQALNGSQHIRQAALRDLPGDMSPVLGSDLDPFRDKLLVLRGLDLPGQLDHNGNRALSAAQNGKTDAPRETIDQIIARSPGFYGTPPARRSVHLLVRGYQIKSRPVSAVSLNGEVRSIEHEDRPEVAFDSLFGEATTSPDAGNAERRRMTQVSIFDRLRAHYDRVIDNPRLSREDRDRLDGHLSYLDDVSNRVREGAGHAVGCTIPSRPSPLDRRNDDNLPRITRNQIDVAAAAVRCDMTRVVTLQLCPATDIRTFPWLGLDGNHHHYSHQTESSIDVTMGRIGHWYAQQLAYLLEQLDVVEDPVTGRTYLDNSLVYWGNEFGINPNGAHQALGMPVVLAGSAGGLLETGRYIDYRDMGAGRNIYDQPGRRYNELLIAIMQAMGLSHTEWETGGETGFGYYPGSRWNYPETDRRTPLPYLFA